MSLRLPLLFLVSGWLFFSCASTKNKQKTIPEENPMVEQKAQEKQASTADSLFFHMHRTSCYGRCPAYKVSIYNSGYAEYEGIIFVEKKGIFETRINEEDLQKILDRALQLNYFDLEDAYNSNITDIPSTTTTLHADGRKKSVFNRDGGPNELIEFENFVDRILDRQSWTKVKEPDVIRNEEDY